MSDSIIRIAIVGEGITDCGTNVPGVGLSEGPVEMYIRKIATDCEIEFQLFTRSQLKNDNSVRLQRKSLLGLSGSEIQAVKLAAIAGKQGFDIAAFFCDCDNPGNGHNTEERAIRRSFERLYEEIQNALEKGIMDKDTKPLVIIPIKMIESWIMSDPDSFRIVFGRKGKADFPDYPELDWGDLRDPKSNFPKCRLNRIMEVFDAASSPETYYDIAENSNIDELCRKCPIGFGQFHKDLSLIIKSMNQDC